MFPFLRGWPVGLRPGVVVLINWVSERDLLCLPSLLLVRKLWSARRSGMLSFEPGKEGIHVVLYTCTVFTFAFGCVLTVITVVTMP